MSFKPAHTEEIRLCTGKIFESPIPMEKFQINTKVKNLNFYCNRISFTLHINFIFVNAAKEMPSKEINCEKKIPKSSISMNNSNRRFHLSRELRENTPIKVSN